MSSQSENLKVIFYDPSVTDKVASIVADGYFSFVPHLQRRRRYSYYAVAPGGKRYGSCMILSGIKRTGLSKQTGC